MNINMFDSVKNWLHEFIRKRSKLVVVQFEPLQTENATLQFDPNSFFIPESYLVRSSNVGVGISEILKKNKFSLLTHTYIHTRNYDVLQCTKTMYYNVLDMYKNTGNNTKITYYYQAKGFASGPQTPQNLPPLTCSHD